MKNAKYSKHIKNNNNDEKTIITATYKVEKSDTLLSFLLKKIKNSRNNIKMLLSNHQVLVNGTVETKFDFPLAKDDEIKITKKPFIANNKDNHDKTEKIHLPKIEIIYEDADFIAINKPAGLLSVESDKSHTQTAYNLVLTYLQNKDKALRPYIVHRIDKETSGVLLFAKNIKIHSMLKLNWTEYVKKREYYAVIEGNLDKKSGTIKSYLKQNKNNLMYSSLSNDGDLAITNFEVIKENKNYSLIRVLIDTGRKNQIRVHFKELSHPIIGDDKYGSGKTSPIKRLGLHASTLEFVHPITKNNIVIKTSYPNVFNSLF